MKRVLKAKDFCAWFSQWGRSCNFQKETNWSQIVFQWASNFICQLQHVPSACYAVFVCILLDLRKSLTANVPRKRKSWWKTLHCFPRYPLTWLEPTDARTNVAADLESNEIEGHYRNKTKITKNCAYYSTTCIHLAHWACALEIWSFRLLETKRSWPVYSMCYFAKANFYSGEVPVKNLSYGSITLKFVA